MTKQFIYKALEHKTLAEWAFQTGLRRVVILRNIKKYGIPYGPFIPEIKSNKRQKIDNIDVSKKIYGRHYYSELAEMYNTTVNVIDRHITRVGSLNGLRRRLKLPPKIRPTTLSKFAKIIKIIKA